MDFSNTDYSWDASGAGCQNTLFGELTTGNSYGCNIEKNLITVSFYGYSKDLLSNFAIHLNIPAINS